MFPRLNTIFSKWVSEQIHPPIYMKPFTNIAADKNISVH